jgi:AAA+ ATPase superfamily predicted ATPase
VTGAPTVSVAIERSNTEYTVKNIFEYLKQSGKEVYVAIDEFQTITDYPEQGTEALLRSYIQFIHNVHFIFSGSKQHLMYEMFGSPKRPFYQSTAMMTLLPLHEEVYYDFASQWFEAKKGSLSREVFQQLYSLFDGYTWYLQSVLNRLYETERHVADYQQVREAILSILNDKASQYEMVMTFLTDNQRNLLKAIAKDSLVPQLQANDFIRKHDLPSASSIKKALTVLQDKDLVYQTPKGYIVYDRFLDLWLKRTFI